MTTANDEEDENATETPMFEDHNEFLHGQRSKKDRIISSKFIRKYLYVAKMQNPTLTKVKNKVIPGSLGELKLRRSLVGLITTRTRVRFESLAPTR